MNKILQSKNNFSNNYFIFIIKPKLYFKCHPKITVCDTETNKFVAPFAAQLPLKLIAVFFLLLINGVILDLNNMLEIFLIFSYL